MFWRILFDSVVRRKFRKGLAIFAVWIGITLVVGLLVLSIDTGDKMNRELGSFGANIKVTPLSSSIPVSVGDYSWKASAYLEESAFPKLKEIFWRNNIMGIVPRLWGEGQLKGTKVPLLGLWLEYTIPLEKDNVFVTGARHVYKHWAIQGNWPLSGEQNAGLIGQALAKRLGIFQGDQVEVKTGTESLSFRISGIVSTGGEEDSAVVLPLKSVQRLTGLQGKVSEADVSALTTPENKLAEKYRLDPNSLTSAEYERWYCTPYPENVASGIQETIPNSAARVVRRISETQGAVLTRIKGLMILLAIFTLISCCLSIMGILASAVLDRRSEVALLQALGAKRINVLALFLVEVAFLGVLGGLLGGVTGSWVGRGLVEAVFGGKPDNHLALVILSPFLGLIVAWLGSLGPVWKALGENTTQVLHGN